MDCAPPQEPTLFPIRVRCPKTSMPVDTGLHSSQDAWQTTDYTNKRFLCAACGEVHTWSKPDAWLESTSSKH